MRSRVVVLVVVALAVVACGSTDPRTPEGGQGIEDWVMPKAVPAFAAHFTDPLYEDVSDERTPFGSDAGADILAEWAVRRDELGPDSTVADVLGGDPEDYLGDDSFDDPQMVQGAGFTLLRLTGHIDEEGRRATLAALDSLLSPDLFGPDPLLIKQRDDLRSWSE